MFSRALRNSVFSHRLPPATLTRNCISTYPSNDEEQMTLTNDGRVIVCWHPEKSFPYECSKPLPDVPAQPNSIFKIENKEDVYKIFKNKKEEFVRQELMKLTFTTKHRWFPRARDKKAKQTKPNRPYL